MKKSLFYFVTFIVISLLVFLFLRKTSKDCFQSCADSIMSSHKIEAGFRCIRKQMNLNTKVVSYSLWGPLKNVYRHGIQDNLDLMRTQYPDWVMRLQVVKYSNNSRDLVTEKNHHFQTKPKKN